MESDEEFALSLSVPAVVELDIKSRKKFLPASLDDVEKLNFICAGWWEQARTVKVRSTNSLKWLEERKGDKLS